MLWVRFSDLQARPDDEQDAFLRQVEALVGQARYAEALRALLDAANIENANHNSDFIRNSCIYYLCNAYKTLGREKDYAARSAILGTVRPDTGPLEYAQHLGLSRTIVERKKAAVSRGMPSIFITSLPKSASAFLTTAFEQAYGLAALRLGWGEEIEEHYFTPFLEGGCVTHNHVPATQANLSFLSCLNPPYIVIQVRDPRQVIWSLYHHLSVVYGKVDLAQLIGREYRPLVTWIQEWFEAIPQLRSSGVSPILVNYKDIQDDSRAVLQWIAEQYGLDPARADAWLAANGGRSSPNFRSGDSEEWRREIPASEIAAMEAATPTAVREYFGF